MEAQANFDPEQIASLRSAINRNPQKVLSEVKNFLAQGIAIYNRGIIRNPWRMGGAGGGAPVDTGNLRDTHRKEFGPWEAKIMPTAPYAAYVHGLDGQTVNKRGVQLRPWLNYVADTSDNDIQGLELKLLENIVADLAK